MAPITLYDASVGFYISGMITLQKILRKASEIQGHESFPSSKLYEDMRPLTFQIQVASNTAKKSAGRLTGREFDKWEDNETTMSELIARVEKTLTLLNSIDPNEIIGVDDKLLPLPTSEGGIVEKPLLAITLSHAVPNFFFHINMAYAILRSKGVPLGKDDYLEAFNKLD
jgi:hypothetical protein